MRTFRGLGVLLVLGSVIGLVANSAQARGSRRNSSGRGIVGSSDRNEERERKAEERRKKSEEESKQRTEETKKRTEDRKKEVEARHKEAIEKAKAATAKKAAPTKPKTAQGPKKNSSGTAKAGASADQREGEAAKLREQAEAQFEKGELIAGVKLLRQAIEECDGTQAAVGCEDRLEQLVATEPFGSMILLGEGEELFGQARYRRAWNKYRALLQRYPNSEQAAEARKRLDEIEANDLLSKTVYTDEELEDARLWFLAGSIHLENGRKSEATAAYQKVIEEYPGCRFANMAKEKLAVARES